MKRLNGRRPRESRLTTKRSPKVWIHLNECLIGLTFASDIYQRPQLSLNPMSFLMSSHGTTRQTWRPWRRRCGPSPATDSCGASVSNWSTNAWNPIQLSAAFHSQIGSSRLRHLQVADRVRCRGWQRYAMWDPLVILTFGLLLIVSIDWLTEEIEKFEDYVQSVDIAAFQKI